MFITISFFISFDFRHPTGVSGILEVVTDGGTPGRLARWIGEGAVTTPTPSATSLTATPGCDGNKNKVDLSWPAITGATQYWIGRCSAGATECTNTALIGSYFATAAWVDAPATSVKDDLNLWNSGDYWYVMKETQPADGPYSPIVRTTTLACAPTPTTYIDAAKFISQQVPITLATGSTNNISITMKNCRPDGQCGAVNNEALNTWVSEFWDRYRTDYWPRDCVSCVIIDLADFQIASSSNSAYVLWNGKFYRDGYPDGLEWSGGPFRDAMEFVPGSNVAYALGQDGRIYMKEAAANSWSAVTTGVAFDDFYALAPNEIFALRGDDNIWRWNGVRWSRVTSGLKIHKHFQYVRATSDFYGLSAADNGIYKWAGAGWNRVAPPSPSGPLDGFWAVSPTNIYALVKTDELGGLLAHWDGTAWKNITVSSFRPGTRLQYVSPTLFYATYFMPDDTRFSLEKGRGRVDKIYFNDARGSWDSVPLTNDLAGDIPIKDFSVVAENDIYALGGNNRVYHWTGRINIGSWTDMGGVPAALFPKPEFQLIGESMIPGFSIAESRIDALWSNGQIFQLDGTGWRALTESAVVDDFQAMPDGKIYAIKDDGNVWRWNGVKWSQVTSGLAVGKKIHALRPSAILALGRSDGKLYFWNGSSWQVIAVPGATTIRYFDYAPVADFPSLSTDEFYVLHDGGLSRWDGTGWKLLAQFGEVYAMEKIKYQVGAFPWREGIYGLADGTVNYPIKKFGSYRFKLISDNPAWNGREALVRGGVGAGAEATFDFPITVSSAPGRYSLFGCMSKYLGFNECSPPVTITVAAFIDIGLRVFDGTATVAIAAEPGAPTSPLRIARDGVTYGIVLVDPGDSNATKVRINTAQGVKALRKFSP